MQSSCNCQCSTSCRVTYEDEQRADEDSQYEELLSAVQKSVSNRLREENHLFRTNTTSLYEEFLSGIPLESRQRYTCSSCRHFFERYAGLVTIDPETGKKTSVAWSEKIPPFFAHSGVRLRALVESSDVVGVFLSDSKVWGKPITGKWRHLSASVPSNGIAKKHPLLTFSQVEAEKSEDFKNLQRTLEEFRAPIVEKALEILKTDSLYRSEKCLGVAEWLNKLQERLSSRRGPCRSNIIWHAVASAPPGFCHVRSTMIGTLLEDLSSWMSFETVSKRFADKMHPLKYMRPTAAPTDGQIAAAEKVVDQLASSGALKRRFARLEDIETIWRPTTVEKDTSKGGVFSHLKKEKRDEIVDMSYSVTAITFEKFVREVLPDAVKIEYSVPSSHQTYAAFTTASDMSAPPIVKWDTAEFRNPVGWYLYASGSMPYDWNLSAGTRVEVTAISLQPSMWHGEAEKFSHMGRSAMFVLKGARDKNYRRAGNALFPELLKNEYHSVRSVIESYSRGAQLEGYEEASACGLLIDGRSEYKHVFRVTTKKTVKTYKVDRWN